MPMMYMDDAIAATIKLCKRQKKKSKSVLHITCSNELTPTEIAAEIKKHIPELRLATNQTARKLLTAGLQVLMTTKPERLVGIMKFDFRIDDKRYVRKFEVI
jgi:dTDP-4-dehydrorhamnose reductase